MITSLENPKMKYLAKLANAKFRKKEQCFVVEGSHLVEEARMKGCLIEAYSIVEKDGYMQVSEAVMKKIANTDTIVKEIGLCKMMESHDLSSHLLVLDGIQDPGNMGALMRSAKAFGFNTIVLGNGCVDIYNDKVIRASQGAIFKLSFIHQDLVDFLTHLKDYEIYGTNVVNGIPLDSVSATTKLALVLGNEGNGISKEVAAIIKKNIFIPMQDMESLNVSVAGGIIMYTLKKE